MKPGNGRIPNRYALAAGGIGGMALFGLIACTMTAPVSRQADPAFARKIVTYLSREPPGTTIVDPGSHFLHLVQGGAPAIFARRETLRYWSGTDCRKRSRPPMA